MRLQRFFVGCPFFLIHDSSTMTPLPPARPASAVPVSPAAPRRIGGRGARGEGRSSSAFIASGVGSDPAPHIRHGKHLLFPTPPAAAMHRGAGAIPGRDPGRVPHYPQLPTYTPQSNLIHTPGIDYQPMPHAVPSSTITSTSTYMPTNAPPSLGEAPWQAPAAALRDWAASGSLPQRQRAQRNPPAPPAHRQSPAAHCQPQAAACQQSP